MLSHEEICKTIGLPSAITNRTIEGERSVPRIHVATLCHRLVGSDRFLMGQPTPPTTPPTLQHNHIDTDFITENRDDNASTTISNLGAGLGQASNCHPSHPTCSAGSLTLTETAGTGLSKGPRVETDNTASCVAGHVAGQELRMRRGK